MVRPARKGARFHCWLRQRGGSAALSCTSALALQAALVGKLHHAAALDAVAPLSEARARLLPKLSARLRDERCNPFRISSWHRAS